MLDLFKKNHLLNEPVVSSSFSVQSLHYPSINFKQFVRGIDNVHIDVHLSPHFTELSNELILELLNEHSCTKGQQNKPSNTVAVKLEAFNVSYASMLTAAIHRAKENKRIDSVQLFQTAVIKFVLNTVRAKTDQLLHNLRKATIADSTKNFKLSKQIAWINRNKNNLLYQVTNELFEQIQWIEIGTVGKLRESLLGITWTIPKEMLFNPLLQTPEKHHVEVVMKHYVLLSQDLESGYSFKHLNRLIDQLLEEIANICQLQIESKQEENITTNDKLINKTKSPKIYFSWKDVPANMDILFNCQETQQALELESQQSELKAKLQCQHKVNKILEQRLRQAQILLHLLAAYETPRLYEHYVKLIKPYLLYQALCNDIEEYQVAQKLQNQLKIRSLRDLNHKSFSINELKTTKKRLAKSARHPDSNTLRRFMIDFVTYRRDLKYHHLMH